MLNFYVFNFLVDTYKSSTLMLTQILTSKDMKIAFKVIVHDFFVTSHDNL